MKWGIYITTIKIKWHFSFFLYLILAIFGGLIKEVFIVLILLIMHELGHFFFLRLFKYEVKEVDVFPFGLIMTFSEHKNDFNYKKVLISSGGIIGNLILCFLLFPFQNWFIANVFILIINLLPIFPLDGGRIMSSILQYLIPYKYSKKGMIVWGLIVSVLIMVYLVFFYRRIYLLLIMMLILKLNFEHYQELKTDWVLFTTNKYLYPNQKLLKKNIKHWFKHPINSIFAGKNNVYDFGGYKLEEEKILKDYIEKAR